MSHAPAPLERALTAPGIAVGKVVKWVHVPRGPVRLEIEMPARANFRFLTGTLISVLVAAAFIGLLTELVARRTHIDLPLWMLLVPLAVGTATVLIGWLATQGPFAARETLEIDSRIVALRRGHDYIAAWERATFDDVRAAQPGAKYRVMGKAALGGEPSIVWGFYDTGMMCVGGAGAGIHHEAAERVMREIQSFRAENPAAPESKRTLGRIAVR